MRAFGLGLQVGGRFNSMAAVAIVGLTGCLMDVMQMDANGAGLPPLSLPEWAVWLHLRPDNRIFIQ